jgi:hypothetical protein
MPLQGLFGVLLSNRANLESAVIPQLKLLLSPYSEVLANPDAKQFCPTPEQIQRILTAKDNIESSVITLQRRATSLQTILERVQLILTLTPPIITLLKALPVPNQFTTAGFVVTLSDRLESVKELAQKYRGEVVAGTYVVSTVNGTFTSILQLLDNLEQVLAICAPEQLQQNEELRRLAQSFNTPITQFDNSYKGYTIEIKTVDKQAVAPQRYAVAIDRSGVVVLEGRPSFSSSTQVLIDEIKFRIDQLSI